MSYFKIPWSCLESPITAEPSHNGDQGKPFETLKPTKTFVETLSNVGYIPLSQIPQPCLKEDMLAIVIPKEEYISGVEACKHNLHGCIIWPKGTSPLIVAALKNKLTLF
ncbi:unnamed protein product [Lathyrus oleraceus]